MVFVVLVFVVYVKRGKRGTKQAHIESYSRRLVLSRIESCILFWLLIHYYVVLIYISVK